ncbi:MAG: hypothetical protein LBC74_00415 [Planctomycetaceae bacterium]|jgi:hypothetical protein|nr:hypothetical protein [Planctomycetaceae bacterium]
MTQDCNYSVARIKIVYGTARCTGNIVVWATEENVHHNHRLLFCVIIPVHQQKFQKELSMKLCLDQLLMVN